MPRSILLNIHILTAIFIAKNQAAFKRTKHIDINYNFIRDLMDKDINNYLKNENNVVEC